MCSCCPGQRAYPDDLLGSGAVCSGRLEEQASGAEGLGFFLTSDISAELMVTDGFLRLVMFLFLAIKQNAILTSTVNDLPPKSFIFFIFEIIFPSYNCYTV